MVSFRVDQLRDEAISAFHGFLGLPVEFEVELEDFLDALLDYKGEGKEEPDKISEKNAILAILGQHYELIPFGSGRRICVEFSLAHRVVQLGLATLLHSFDWELACNVTPKNMDVTERMRITVRKLVPLTAIPKRRTV
ncbi:hypothetical protein Acr_24g0005910 [Actinidia rufa]|uniref:Uncharacterized protein n=1 Tax=Actinidia rufa TaxID=165716 RepID=A0A7J0GUI8_9ERIC|nr:hypothetical protein Acr_24g0005910 [Actinidia rufa]